jgi:hypothetical protein
MVPFIYIVNSKPHENIQKIYIEGKINEFELIKSKFIKTINLYSQKKNIYFRTHFDIKLDKLKDIVIRLLTPPTTTTPSATPATPATTTTPTLSTTTTPPATPTPPTTNYDNAKANIGTLFANINPINLQINNDNIEANYDPYLFQYQNRYLYPYDYHIIRDITETMKYDQIDTFKKLFGKLFRLNLNTIYPLSRNINGDIEVPLSVQNPSIPNIIEKQKRFIKNFLKIAKELLYRIRYRYLDFLNKMNKYVYVNPYNKNLIITDNKLSEDFKNIFKLFFSMDKWDFSDKHMGLYNHIMRDWTSSTYKIDTTSDIYNNIIFNLASYFQLGTDNLNNILNKEKIHVGVKCENPNIDKYHGVKIDKDFLYDEIKEVHKKQGYAYYMFILDKLQKYYEKMKNITDAFNPLLDTGKDNLRKLGYQIKDYDL